MDQISVIVPVYNAGLFLEPLIKSILSQTYSNIELLLIDDGSTDGSADRCEGYASLDRRVHVFHQQNKGQSAARNYGLKKANGTIIAFADHDDFLHPRMYEVLIKGLQSTEVAVSACEFKNTPTDQIERLYLEEPKDNLRNIDACSIISHYFIPDWHVPIWNKLYRREIIEDIRFHNARLGEDNLFSYKVIKRCESIVFCDTPMYFQRMHGNNFEFTGIRYMDELIQAKETILHDIKTSFPESYRQAQCDFLLECVRVFNLYVRTNDSSFDLQKQNVFDMMRDNSIGLFHASLPLGQKILFNRYRFLKKKAPDKEILI